MPKKDTGLLKLPKSPKGIDPWHHYAQNDPSHLAMKSGQKFQLRASKIIQKKKAVIVVDWVERKTRGGYRSVPKEPTPSTSRSKPGKASGKNALDNHPPLSMNIDESWMEEPVEPPKKRVSIPNVIPQPLLTHVSVRAHLHGRIYFSYRPLLALHSRC